MRRITNAMEYQHCKGMRDNYQATLDELRTLPVPDPQPNQPYPERLRRKNIESLEWAISEATAEIERWESCL